MTVLWPPLVKKYIPSQTDIPMDLSAYGTGNSGFCMCIDNYDNIYVHNQGTNTIFKMKGSTNILDASIPYPSAYSGANWEIVNLSWDYGRLCLCMRNRFTPDQRWIELGSFNENDIVKDMQIPIIGLSDTLAWMEVDYIRNELVGVTNQSFGPGGDTIIRYDYDTATPIWNATYPGFWGRMHPNGNGSYLQGFIDDDNHLLYGFYQANNASNQTLRAFDYTSTEGRITQVGTTSSIQYIRYEGSGRMGCCFDKYGDLWHYDLGSYPNWPGQWAFRFYGLSNIRNDRIIV